MEVFDSFMLTFRINEYQREIISKAVVGTEISNRLSYKEEVLIIELDNDVQLIVDLLEDFFLKNGIDENDEANKYGKEIEKVADIFIRVLCLINEEKIFCSKNQKTFLKAKNIFYSCKGDLTILDVITKKKYLKMRVPPSVEEKWLLDLS